jgi:hypothetical protein
MNENSRLKIRYGHSTEEERMETGYFYSGTKGRSWISS